MSTSDTAISVTTMVLYEGKGLTVTVELKSGEIYRGKMVDVEDNMNCLLSDVTYTGRDGRVSHLEAIYIRGSRIRFIVLPDMLKNAPMFKKDPKANRGKNGGNRNGRGGSRGGRGGRGGASRHPPQ